MSALRRPVGSERRGRINPRFKRNSWSSDPWATRSQAQSTAANGIPRSLVSQRLILVGTLDDVATDRLDLLRAQDLGEPDHALIAQRPLMHHARPGLAVRDQRAAAQVRQHRAAVGGVAMAAAAEASVLTCASGNLLGRAGCGGSVVAGSREEGGGAGGGGGGAPAEH